MSAPVTVDLQGNVDALVGTEVAVSEWLCVAQSTVGEFADATGDHQWIHIDPERAARETPFGGTIAHGLLTLSLLPRLFQSTIALEPRRMGINVGFNRVRFTSPVCVGTRIRARFTLQSAEKIAGGLQFVWKVTVESEGNDKPACVAEWVTRALT